MGILAGFGVLETEGGGLMGRNFALTFIFVIALALTALLFVFELAHVWIETNERRVGRNLHFGALPTNAPS